MECIQIIRIVKQSNNQSKYNLQYKELRKLLDTIGNRKIAVISIAGPSRTGKSFLLSYMIRYLSNHHKVNWIGDKNEQLKGFDWKNDLNPQTSGIWLSRPYFMSKSDGSEIAVVLMDTQGVFDEFASQRDWSTIVGLSLLCSSYLIFNLFNNLQEDILMVLESFLQYGLLASETSGDSENETPFQSLMFLIRDWNYPAQCPHGFSGGQKFLDKKLEIKPGMSSSSQTARHLINKCFKNVSCFLMPDPGEKAREDLEFNGSVADLSSRFVNKIQELIPILLNADHLKPKTINSNCLTANELSEYFKAFVEIFNSNELPKPTDIVEATAKTADFLQINKIKDLYVNSMQTLLKEKPFVCRQELEKTNNVCKYEAKHDFKNCMKTTNEVIEQELMQMFQETLESVYSQIYNKNEQSRDRYVTDQLERYCSLFTNELSAKLEPNFVEPNVLDETLNHQKLKIIKMFETIDENEDKSIFLPYYIKLTNFIEKTSETFKSNNYRRLTEAERNNSFAVSDSLENYRQSMKSFLSEEFFRSKEEFNAMDKQLRTESRNLFTEKCIFGDQKYIKRFEYEFEQKLKDEKKEFKDINETKRQKTISETKNDVKRAVMSYNSNMNGIMETVESDEQLLERHSIIKSSTIQQFRDCCQLNNSEFLNTFIDELDKEIDESLTELKSKFNDMIDKKQNYLRNYVIECKNVYLSFMKNVFTEDKYYSNDELKDFHDNHKNNAILKFQSIPNPGMNVNTKQHLYELEESIDREYEELKVKNKLKRDLDKEKLENKVKDYLFKYEEQMEEFVETVGSESELIERHEKVKTDIIDGFRTQFSSYDSKIINKNVEKLEESIAASLQDLLELLRLQLKNQESVSKALITDVRKFYRQEMNKYYEKTSFLPKSRLQEIHTKEFNRTVNRFESERGNLSLEKFKSLIQDSIQDIFIEFCEMNDMNTPTIPAIGIDLGTTNSCVAYFKPGKNGGQTIVIPDECGKFTTASAVALLDTEEIVGNVAKSEAFANPRNTIFLAKRLIGKKFDDESVQKDMKLWSYKVVDGGDNKPKYNVRTNGREKTYFPEQISAKVLAKMKKIAENYLGCKVTNAVITVPAYFTDSQKEATKHAGHIAGLNIMKIINEPTAAAIAFKLHRNDETEMRKVLIYDFGGGTFDVAILTIERGSIIIKAVGGDNHLGGDDLDSNIMHFCLNEFERENGIKVPNHTNEGQRAIRRLRTKCEEQKCNLSAAKSVIISLDGFFQTKDISVVLTRDKFEELNEYLFRKSMDLVEATLNDVEFDKEDIDDVVLVGGSSRIPRIQTMLSNLFGGKPLNHGVNPDEAVAIGAAIQAAVLNGDQAQGLKLLSLSDVAPMSLGIKVVGGFMSTLISRNTKVPITKTGDYYTVNDNQTVIDFRVYEGENKMVESNNLLGNFLLKGIPPAPPGRERVDVTFTITDEGILNVKAEIASTGGHNEIEITQHRGRLTNKELAELREQVVIDYNYVIIPYVIITNILYISKFII